MESPRLARSGAAGQVRRGGVRTGFYGQEQYGRAAMVRNGDVWIGNAGMAGTRVFRSGTAFRGVSRR